MDISLAVAPGLATLSIDGYERPDAQLDSDANWLSAQARVSVGNFGGATSLALTTDDLERLREATSKLLREGGGSFAFEAEERLLAISGDLDPRGVGQMVFALSDAIFSGVSVRVTLEVDRVSVASFCERLAAACARFPVRRVE
jgi:hypothetical protein